jgi:hypothetical protein
MDPKDAAEMVKAAVWDRYNNAVKSQHCKFYMDNGLVDTSKYLAIATHNPSIARGIYWLCRLRVGAVWYAARLAAMGYIDQRYRNQCPFCDGVGAETPEHLLLDCDRWRIYRDEYMGEFVASYNPTWVELLGGSNLNGGVEGAGNVDIAPRWCPRNPGHVDVNLQQPQHGNDNEGRLPTSVLVAQYLQRVMPVRFGLMHNLIEGPRADADDGMAVLIDPPELPPNGAEAEVNEAEEVNGDNDGNIDTRGGTVATFAH